MLPIQRNVRTQKAKVLVITDELYIIIKPFDPIKHKQYITQIETSKPSGKNDLHCCTETTTHQTGVKKVTTKKIIRIALKVLCLTTKPDSSHHI